MEPAGDRQGIRGRSPQNYEVVLRADPWTQFETTCSHAEVSSVPAVPTVTELTMSRGVPALALSGLLLTGLLGAVQLLPERAVGVQVNQSFAMPAEGTVTLRGHGYGHGHGMSQYGA